MRPAIGAGSFRRADHLALIEAYGGEDEAQQQRPRHQDEVDQRYGKRNQRQCGTGC